MSKGTKSNIARTLVLNSLIAVTVAVEVISATPCRAEQLFTLMASDAKDADWFGYSGAQNGNLALVGAPTNSPAAGRGAAYLFDTGTGQQLHQFTASDSSLDVRDFGGSVAIDANLALIGARLTSGVGQYSGAAYLFDVGSGQQQRRLTPSDPHAYDFFGASVALSGNRALVGAWGAGDASIVGSGAAYLFDTATGQQLFRLTAADRAQNEWFGYEVAISGNRALISAGQYRNGSAAGPGSVYVFDVSTGQQLFKLAASDATTGDLFGASIAVSGNTALIGSNSGSAYLFDIATGLELFKLPVSDTSRGLASSVALSGAAAVAGNKLFDTNTGQLLTSITDFPRGSVLSLNGNIALIGSHQDSVGRRPGAAYLFRLTAVPEPSTLICLITLSWSLVYSGCRVR